MTMYRSEFDHYNTFDLENRILSPFEVNAQSLLALKERIKSIIIKGRERLKNIQLSIVERNGLTLLVTEALKSLDSANKAKTDSEALVPLKFFYINTYPDIVAQYSGKNLSMHSYYDFIPDQKNSATISRQAIEEKIQVASDFQNDVPMREYNQKEDESFGFLPAIITDNKERIAIGLGSLALGALAYHILYSKKV